MKKSLISCLIFAIFFFIWESVCCVSEHLHFILPLPSKIAAALWEHADRFSFHTGVTLREMLGGFLLALAAAFPLAWLMAYFSSLRAIIQPAFVAIQCIPMFALAPLMVLWFGWTYTAIVVPTALMIFFPLAMNIYQGLCATPKNLLELFALYQALPSQIFFKLQLPWALPQIFAGFRISIALAGIGAVAGEWAGAQAGLGILMLESRRSADMEMMFGALACVTAMSLALYGFVVLLEKGVNARLYRKISPAKCLACLLAVGFLGSCQQSSEPGTTTLVLDWLPNPNHVPLYAGVKKGFFEEQGIHLKILKVADQSDSISYLTSKQSELALTYMPHALQTLAHGAQIVPLGILIKEPLNAVIFRKNEGIAIPEDLTGKIVGYCVDGSHTRFLRTMLQSREIVPHEYRNVGYDLVSALAMKHVDMLYGAYWNIECENLRALEVETEVFPLALFGVPPYYELLFFARQDSLQATPQFISAFQQALQKSIDFSKNFPEEAFDLYLSENLDKSSKTKKWERKAWYKTLSALAQQQTIDQELWNNFVEWLTANQLLSFN